LWPIAKRKEGEFTLRVAPYVLQLEEKKTLTHMIEELKTPTSYSNTPKKHIRMGTSKLQGLKAHDYHVHMQQILPFCVHTLMPKGLQLAIICMSQVFQSLCAKTIDPSMMNDLKQEGTITPCMSFGKRISSISFQHYDTYYGESNGRGRLVWPCTYSTDVPHGKYVKSLKTYVWNMARLEGSMVEGYTMEEAIGFCP
jgi:hypothetical protein